MRVAVPRETRSGEQRVALVPETIAKLREAGLEVLVEAGAGTRAGFPDAAYLEAGAQLVVEAGELYAQADVVLTVQAPTWSEAAGAEDGLREGSTLLGFLQPFTSPELLRRLAERRVTSFAMELIPRTTRAQKMDALSSQATVAGYKAALLGASSLGKFFPMLMTAAGTVAPARVLVLGAGVAGLQAIATARRLGAVVQAFDIRPAAKQEVESLGATFVGLTLEEAADQSGYAREVSEDVKRREHELLARLVADADVVITTALVPGKAAPVLITEPMVRAMRLGSVIVDLAAEAGGNCELTEPGREIERYGVLIHGLVNPASSLPTHASQMYSRNISALLLHLVQGGELKLDPEDEITRGCLVTHGGQVVHPAVRALVAASSE
ncbi:MAG: Re/Si-specific NAD(P)(+) transhydrogenase subunit alpha [Gemmatimonadetes bacterium]|nr:Re/Si-specific NAD(P)(+) transhydrogenase subunit alpha [Gemmatimonadota bacterium]